MLTVDERIKRALSAKGDELWKFVRDSVSDVVLNAVLNKDLSEEMAVYLAKQKSTASEVLGILAHDVRFKDSYKLKRFICRNPKTPLKISMSLLKHLRLFDLGDMTRDQNIPINLRQKIEYSIAEKIPSMPEGNKIALSKRSSSTIAMALLEKGDGKVINACLESPLLTEGHLCKVINKPQTKPLIIQLIAEHPKWSLRYAVRYALIRNYHTQLVRATSFLKDMKTADLKDLYEDRSLPISTQPFIYRELLDRDDTVSEDTVDTYDISDGEDSSDIDMTDLQ
jgi:hypothetical protein